MGSIGKLRNISGSKSVLNGIAYLAYIFLYLPILVVIIYSFNKSEVNVEFTGFTMKWYGELFAKDRDLWTSLRTSVELAIYSTIISCVIGTFATIAMHRYKFPGKQLIENLLYIPIVIPEIVIGIAFLATMSMFGVDMSMATLVISHVTFCIPFVIFTLRPRISGFDASIEEAAMDLGATQWRTLRRVTLPMLTPGILASALMSITLSIDDVTISFFAAGPDNTTLPIRIYGMVRGKISPDVYGLCVVIMAATVLLAGVGMLIMNLNAARTRRMRED